MVGVPSLCAEVRVRKKIGLLSEDRLRDRLIIFMLRVRLRSVSGLLPKNKINASERIIAESAAYSKTENKFKSTKRKRKRKVSF